MKIFVQWATDPPSGYVEMDSSEWKNAPSKPLPDGTEMVDSQLGYVASLNVQGAQFYGYDHLAVIDIPATQDILVAAWKDDVEDMPTGEHFARIVRFGPPVIDRTSFVGYATVMSQQILCNPVVKERFLSLGPLDKAVLGDFVNFNKPKSSLIKHGVWLSDEMYAATEQKRTTHRWMEWIN